MEQQIAVIGMAGQFPGAANLSEFSRQLQKGIGAIGEISPERLALTTLPPHRRYQRRGYLDRIDCFDHAFFQIPAGEAIHMDPHQRLLIERVHECMENAGYTRNDLRGTNTAVFVAHASMQYYRHAEEFAPTLVTGNASEFLAARINRVFDLQGSVAVVDTSCSSGLVALHHACNELLLDNADQAFVCGVNLELFPFLDPGQHIEVDSPDGLSIPFSDRSNGMVYGEAVITLLLKRLSLARQHGDPIQAVIRSSAVNNNAARSASLTAPDSIAQADVIVRSWKKAGIDPRDIGFIEAHGSGTQLGDSLEVAGLNRAFAQFGADPKSCPISTVKANIGHSRSAAGLAGLVKAILSVQQGAVFPAIYTGRSNPHIDFNKGSVYISQQATLMRVSGSGSHLAAVSSIGFSGTNCHVVVEDAPAITPTISRTGDSYPVWLSSWHEQGLTAFAQEILNYVRLNPDTSIADLSFTLTSRREHFSHRKAFLAASVHQLQSSLESFLLAANTQSEAKPPLLIFLLGGSVLTADPAHHRYSFLRPSLDLLRTRFAETGLPLTQTINMALTELAAYQSLCAMGFTPGKMVGIGRGKWIAEYIDGRIDLQTMALALETHQPLPENDLSVRTTKLILREAQDATPFFVAADTANLIYRFLTNLSPLPVSCHTFALIEADHSNRAAHLCSALFDAGYALKQPYRSGYAGNCIALPSRIFVSTRCWIREDVHPAFRPDNSTPSASPSPLLSPILTDPLGKLLRLAWESALTISITDAETDFFAAGGNSLKATKMINVLRRKLHLSLSFEDIFDYPAFSSFRSYVESRMTTADGILLVWKEVLKKDNLTVDDDFFQLGGHSLLANQVLNRLRTQYNIRLDFEDFFRYPTVRQFADLIDKRVLPRQASLTGQLIPPAPPAADYPVTHAQRRLWILDQASPEPLLAYNETNAFRLTGSLDTQRLATACRLLIERHEVLRTCLPLLHGEPRQKILDADSIPGLKIVDLSTQSDLDASAQQAIDGLAAQPFDLLTGPLIRLSLFRLSKDQHLLAVSAHHAVTDQWSFRILLRDLCLLYAQAGNPNPTLLPNLRIQHKDIAVWLLSQTQTERRRQEELFWQSSFEGTLPVLNLPLDHPRTLQRSYFGNRVTRELPASFVRDMHQLNRRNGITSFMTLLSFTWLLLSKYGDQDDIILGTPVLGREEAELEDQLGLFANTLALRIRANPDQPLASLLAHCRSVVTGAFAHQSYPFDILVEQLAKDPDPSRFPLFDVMVVYRNESGENIDSPLPDLGITPVATAVTTSKFDLTFHFVESSDKIRVDIFYNTGLFLPDTVGRLVDYFCRLAETAVNADSILLRQIDYLPPAEKLPIAYNGQYAQIRDSWGATVPIDAEGLLFVGPTSGDLQPTNRRAIRTANNDIRLTVPAGKLLYHKGYRLNAVDIESVINQHPEIAASLVVTRDADLIAFVQRTLPTPAAIPSAEPLETQTNNPPVTSKELALIESFQQPAKPIDTTRFLPDYLDHWCRRHPDNIAVRSEHKELTYLELAHRSIFLAQLLDSQGIQKGEIIPVYCTRSEDLLIAMLAIFRLGAVYLPLGIDLPFQRAAHIIQAVKARHLLTTNATFLDEKSVISRDDLNRMVDTILIEESSRLNGIDQSQEFASRLTPGDLAYIIYTSGTTGTPKGVMIEHAGMMNHLFAKIDLLQLNQQSVIVQNAPQSFDISIWQLLVAIVTGGTVLIYPDHQLQQVGPLLKRLETDAPTIMEMVPSFAHTLLTVLEQRREPISWQPEFVLMTGETLHPSLVKKWFDIFPRVRLVNAYGPTEAADDITHHILTGYDPAEIRIPIGKPIPNMRIRILNDQHDPCAIGIKGNLYVSGIGVGRGYFGDPEKTAASFMHDPEDRTTRMYRTGDIASWRSDGSIDFFGRMDGQVKINGNRIELPEIEQHLQHVDGILNAVVIPFPHHDNGSYLAAFLIVAPDQSRDAAFIRQQLIDKLPAYMVPQSIAFIEEMPLTPNGKIDRSRFMSPLVALDDARLVDSLRDQLATVLPPPLIPQSVYVVDRLPGITDLGQTIKDWQRIIRPTISHASARPPVTTDQQIMAGIWECILGHPMPSITNNFFEQGGDSLKGMRLLAMTEERMGRRLTLRQLFLHPTIEELCGSLQDTTATTAPPITPVTAAECYPVSHAQRRMWLLDKMGQTGSAYNIPGAMLIDGDLLLPAWFEAWRQLLRRHEVLRTVFVMHDGQPAQRILSADDPGFTITALDYRFEANREEAIGRFLDQESRYRFDLESGPLLRAALIQLDRHQFLFSFTMHHIISDEWSLNILGRDLMTAYQAASTDARPDWRLLPLQYKDYATWQSSLANDHWRLKRDFWTTQLAGTLPVLHLPADFDRPVVQTYDGKSIGRLLTGAGKKWEKKNSRQGSTLFMNMLALVQCLLHRLSGQTDIIIGTPVTGRYLPELQDQVGLYLNTIALRTNIDPEAALHQLMTSARQLVTTAFAHEDYPFDKLVDELDLTRDFSRSPIFDCMLVVHEAVQPESPGNDTALRISSYQRPSTESKFDISFHFRESGDDLYAGINYNTSLFKASTIERWLQLLEQLMDEMLEQDNLTLAHAGLPKNDQLQLLLDWGQGPL
ncbi:MAG TPA: amino acid adenylation domain-containing protein, partial [Puia sp.]|uniref:non-ribosomal peptide synthetase n=1 Tax=Puia sp. TaxID=2045100 RepID=UPI002D147306